MTDIPDRWSEAAPELRQFWDMLDYDAVHILARLNDEDHRSGKVSHSEWLRRRDALARLKTAYAKEETETVD